MSRPRTLVSILASAIQAQSNCRTSGNPYADIWQDRLDYIENNLLPSGSGIDNGTHIVTDECKPDKLVFSCGFHHMNENGFYDGWTEHKISVRPAFDGIDISVSGRNRNDIKDYLGDVFLYCLRELYTIGDDGNPVRVTETQTA